MVHMTGACKHGQSNSRVHTAACCHIACMPAGLIMSHMAAERGLLGMLRHYKDILRLLACHFVPLLPNKQLRSCNAAPACLPP